MIADAERERIGKGFNPDIKPMASILDKINRRVHEAALRKPAEPKEEAPPTLNFSDFADKIMKDTSNLIVQNRDENRVGVAAEDLKVISIEEPTESERKKEGGAAEDEEVEGHGELHANSEGCESENESEDGMEEEKAPSKTRGNEIRLAVKPVSEEVELESEDEEPEEDEEMEEEESESEEESEDVVSEEEEEDNGFTWEQDEPLPEEAMDAAEDGEKKDVPTKPSKAKLPKVNRGFVELEAELSDDEGHLHGDENEEDDDDDGADLADLIDKRRYKENGAEAERRTKFHQNIMNQQDDEDVQKFIEAVETGFRKKRKGLAGEDDEGNDRDARRRRAGLNHLEEDFEGLERIFDAKMLKEEDLSDGEVGMIEAAYKRRNQRLAEKRQRDEEKSSSFQPEKLISEEAIASIITNKEKHDVIKAPLTKKLFIPRDANARKATEEELNKTSSFMNIVQSQSTNRGKVVANRRTFVFGKKSKEASKPSAAAGTKERTTMPQKVDKLLRSSSSLVKLLATEKMKGPQKAAISQKGLLSRIVKM